MNCEGESQQAVQLSQENDDGTITVTQWMICVHKYEALCDMLTDELGSPMQGLVPHTSQDQEFIVIDSDPGQA